ncbi:MAG: VWA domain-containing protein [Planctomycetes bacterium]|nr:VWA domain-containing protein [Planctomycetota bacterium]
MMRTLTFAPLISPALWTVLAVLGVALLVFYAMRRPVAVPRRRWGVVLALMTAGVVLPLVILLNPTWLERIPPPPGRPLLTVLVDRSASMASPDAPGAKNRFQAAAQFTAHVAQVLSDRFDVQARTFAEAATPTDLKKLASLEPDAMTTDLVAAISSSMEDYRPQGQAVVLLSDGIHNGPGGSAGVLDAVRLAKAMGTPIYTRTLGGEVRQWDVAVELRSPQALAHVGQNVPINVRVRHQGLPNTQAQVALLHDGKEIDRRAVMLPAQGPEDLTFYVRKDSSGLYRYEVRAEPMPGEVSLVNNTAAYLLHMVDAPIRILLLEGKPYWDGKFLARTLTSDPAVALDCIVRVANGRFARRTVSRSGSDAGQPDANNPPRAAAAKAGRATDSGTPTQDATRLESWKVVAEGAEILSDAATLKSYQIVVLGRDAEHFLTDEAITNLRTWLTEDGGSLVCYRGSPTSRTNERLDRLLPVQWSATAESRFRIKLTDQGRELQWLPEAAPQASASTLAGLPTLSTAAQVDRVKPLAVVLATATSETSDAERPVVTYQHYGTGRAVVIEGAGMWRWAFLPPEFQEQEALYAAFWQSLLRWLVSSGQVPAGQELVLRIDKVSFSTAEPASATLLVRDATRPQVPAVELVPEAGGDVHTFSPAPFGESSGMFRVVFGKLPEGRYQARIAGSAEASGRTLFDVRSFSEEQLNIQARPDLMARIASDSGGAVLQGNSASEIIQLFKQHLARTHPDRIRRIPAWDRWWVLVAVVMVWTAAWAVRRSGGLV